MVSVIAVHLYRRLKQTRVAKIYLVHYLNCFENCVSLVVVWVGNLGIPESGLIIRRRRRLARAPSAAGEDGGANGSCGEEGRAAGESRRPYDR